MATSGSRFLVFWDLGGRLRYEQMIETEISMGRFRGFDRQLGKLDKGLGWIWRFADALLASLDVSISMADSPVRSLPLTDYRRCPEPCSYSLKRTGVAINIVSMFATKTVEHPPSRLT